MDISEKLMSMEAGKNAHWRFLGTSLLGIGVAMAFILFQTAAVYLIIMTQAVRLSEDQFQDFLENVIDNGVVISISTFVTAIVCSAIIFGIVKLKSGASIRNYLAFRFVSRKTFLTWMGVTLVFMVASDTFTYFLGRPIVPPSVAHAYDTADPVWLIWVALIVAAPFFEELFFRGFLYRGFAASVLRPEGAIALLAFLWAIIHLQYDIYGVVTIFFIGLILGVARWRTGSLLLPMAMHSLINAVAAIEAALLR